MILWQIFKNLIPLTLSLEKLFLNRKISIPWLCSLYFSFIDFQLLSFISTEQKTPFRFDNEDLPQILRSKCKTSAWGLSMVVLWFSQTRIENKLLILKNQRYRFVDRLISILTVIIIMNEHREETIFFLIQQCVKTSQ